MSEISIVRKTVTVKFPNGLHLVPCTRITQAVSGFEGNVRIRKQNKVANAKSIWDLIELAALHGEQLEIEADGTMAVEILNRLEQVFEQTDPSNHAPGTPSTGNERPS